MKASLKEETEAYKVQPIAQNVHAMYKFDKQKPTHCQCSSFQSRLLSVSFSSAAASSSSSSSSFNVQASLLFLPTQSPINQQVRVAVTFTFFALYIYIYIQPPPPPAPASRLPFNCAFPSLLTSAFQQNFFQCNQYRAALFYCYCTALCLFFLGHEKGKLERAACSEDKRRQWQCSGRELEEEEEDCTRSVDILFGGLFCTIFYSLSMQHMLPGKGRFEARIMKMRHLMQNVT